MCKTLFKSAVFSLVLLSLTGCGGSGGDGDEITSVSQLPSNQLPESESIPIVLNLDVPLPSKVISASDIVNATINGLEYTQIDTSSSKNIWKDNSFVSVSTNIRYVAPRCKDSASVNAICGSSMNTGLTKESPWDLLSTANGSQPVPVDTIVWMLPGDYSHPTNDTAGPQEDTVPFEFTLAGGYEKPIHFRPYPGLYVGSNKGVRIDGGIQLSADWVWVWEVEMTSIKAKSQQLSDATIDYEQFEWRPTDASKDYYYPGITNYEDFHAVAAVSGQIDNLTSENAKIINILGHKNGAGFGVWSTAKNFEIHGSIMYDNGWIDDWRAHGHGFYVQNAYTTPHLLSDNIVAGNMGNGLQVYASIENAYKMENVHMIGNAFFAPRFDAINAIKIGKNDSLNLHFEDNYVYGYSMTFPYETTTEYNSSPTPSLYNRTCENNLFYTGYTNLAFDCDSSKNTVLARNTNNLGHAIIRPNKYDPRRANVMLLNPKQKEEFSFSLGQYAVKDDRVIIYNSLDMATPIAYGTYNGVNTTITWPSEKWDVSDTPFGTDRSSNNLSAESAVLVVFNMGQK